MTEQQRIDALKTVAPRIELTRRERLLQIVGFVCSGVACAALTVSVYATKQAWGVASCVNNVLGTRAAPAALDNQAHIDFADALSTLILTPPDSTPKQKAAAVTAFKDAVNSYARTLVKDQDARDATPLGRC